MVICRGYNTCIHNDLCHHAKPHKLNDSPEIKRENSICNDPVIKKSSNCYCSDAILRKVKLERLIL